MRLLARYRNYENNYDCRWMFHFFKALKDQLGPDMEITGVDYPGWVDGEDTHQTIQRVYGSSPGPDWVFESIQPATKKGPYRIASMSIDIHVDILGLTDLYNKTTDFLFMNTTELCYYFPTRELFGKAGCKYLPVQDWVDLGYCVPCAPDAVTAHLTIPWAHLPPSTPPELFNTKDMPKTVDVTIIGAIGGFYPFRALVAKELPALAEENGWSCVIKSSALPRDVRSDIRNSELHPESDYCLGQKYSDALGSTKIFMCCGGMCKYPVQKITEAMMCGAMVLMEKPHLTESMHMIDGENYVACDETDWKDKLKYYLEHTEERELIAQKGYDMVMEYHTPMVRATEFIRQLTDTPPTEGA